MKKEIKDKVGKTLLKIMDSDTQQYVTKASTGVGEDNTGGYLTYNELIEAILGGNFLEGTLYDYTMKFNVSDHAHGLKVPIVDQSKRTLDDGILGGIKDYALEEGDDVTISRPTFNQSELPLVQTGIGVVVTNALRQDSNVLVKFLGEGIKERIKYRLDREILYGTGTRGIYGVGKSGDGIRATKKVTNADPVTVPNLRTMVGWYYGGKNGIWVMAQDVWQEVIDLHSSSTYPAFPLIFTEEGHAYLFGFPVFVSDVMDSRDICLGDFSSFMIGQKELTQDISDHLYFTSNQSAFRTVIRVCGITGWSAPVAGQDGKLRYPYVFSEAGLLGSSSSTDSSESSSSNSSSSLSSNSSSSSESVGNVSTSSFSSASSSSNSSSSNSSSSLSSNSSSSKSSESSSSNSSSSLSSENYSESSDSSSQSSGAKGPCLEFYTASTFVTTAINGTYYWAGRHNNKAYYAKSGKFIFWNTTFSVWAIANTLGASPASWLSSSATGSACPDNTYIDESGTIV